MKHVFAMKTSKWNLKLDLEVFTEPMLVNKLILVRLVDWNNSSRLIAIFDD